MAKMLKHVLYRAFKARRSGLAKLPRDERDDKYKVTELLGFFGYSPKHADHEIPTVSIKNQYPFLTCQWHSAAAQKEFDEGIQLDERSIVIKGKEMGLVGHKGLSNLRSGQKVLKNWGILPSGVLRPFSQNNWTDYISADVNKHSAEAAKHKIKSYWWIDSIADVYKLLDQNRIVVVGMPWYSGFNMGGGFSVPWLIARIIGVYVGGHAFIVKGYHTNYQNKRVFVCQNSYGEGWGDKGKFYITEDYLQKYALDKYGGVVHIDADSTDLPWVTESKALFERLKNNYAFIMRPDSFGELYEITDKSIVYVPIKIENAKMRKEFDDYLRAHERFIGVSEEDFEKLLKYIRLLGLKVEVGDSREVI